MSERKYVIRKGTKPLTPEEKASEAQIRMDRDKEELIKTQLELKRADLSKVEISFLHSKVKRLKYNIGEHRRKIERQSWAASQRKGLHG